MTAQTVDSARRTLTARFKSGAIDSAELDARILVGAVLGLAIAIGAFMLHGGDANAARANMPSKRS